MQTFGYRGICTMISLIVRMQTFSLDSLQSSMNVTPDLPAKQLWAPDGR